jgi:uncharacterized protein (DUF488 family)
MIAPAKPVRKALLTIGYEGLDIDRFVRFLVANQVDVLVDVREIPISRKKGFSKTRLSGALAAEGILYEHLKALGSPSPIRKQLKHDWDYKAFFAAYEEYLDGQEDALKTLRRIVEAHARPCLMCFEKSHDECHRSRLATRTARTFHGGLSVEPVNTFVRSD